jgi:hypothetical protein
LQSESCCKRAPGANFHELAFHELADVIAALSRPEVAPGEVPAVHGYMEKLPAVIASTQFANLIRSLRVSVTFAVRLTGPPL